ncbi:adenylyltransferase/cytidyltransferase family protein [Limisphaera sp. VF-2]|jgi:cytidyltransferase-like protein|uniref:adenylyltransferase/cytidyltransferase family protein n=1 Tax=Limisphaera sp. VF-2 TaxID=3400418 RepID=UPI001761975C
MTAPRPSPHSPTAARALTARHPVVVSGSFDDLRSRDVRFLQEAARWGPVTVLLWTDEVVQHHTGRPPKFPFAERHYLLQALRFVHAIRPWPHPDPITPALEGILAPGTLWIDPPHQAGSHHERLCRNLGLEYHAIPPDLLHGFPLPEPQPPDPGRKNVVVTGCYDWLHSGHVRFFEEVSSLGNLYVIVGHDANIRALKGPGHPLQPQEERRYMVAAIRHVTETLISSGHGWLDADPEIRRLRPHIYAVNEDGDKGGKREYCRQMGIEYVVLKRTPAPGLPARSSTQLRGF